MSIDKLSRLSFFKVVRYEYADEMVADYRQIPRPHFCMALIIKGQAVFDSVEGERAEVREGDLVFVPITSRYVSHWHGSPDIVYITMHFAFEPTCGISERDRFLLQRVRLPDVEKLTELYTDCYNAYKSGETTRQMASLGAFFSCLGMVLPHLQRKSGKPIDTRIEQALEYVNLHLSEPISVSALAQMCGMSVPNFHLHFKRSMGMSPIEYKNHVLIRRTMQLLKGEPQLSIEQISEICGFESSAYFRRLFKKHVGTSPREYRRSHLDM